MMKRILTATALTALIVLTASCCPCRKVRTTVDQPLVGTSWQLVQLDGRTVEPEGENFTVTFGTDRRISGRGACNRLTGQYETGEHGALTIGQAAATRMACLKDGDLETAFQQMLSGATHYEIDGDDLLILTDSELRGVLRAR